MDKVKGSSELQSRTTDIGGKNDESHSSGHLEVIRNRGGNENKIKKVKLKVSGVTCTIQTNSHGVFSSGTAKKTTQSSDAPRPRSKPMLQDNSHDDCSRSSDKKSGL